MAINKEGDRPFNDQTLRYAENIRHASPDQPLQIEQRGDQDVLKFGGKEMVIGGGLQDPDTLYWGDVDY